MTRLFLRVVVWLAMGMLFGISIAQNEQESYRIAFVMAEDDFALSATLYIADLQDHSVRQVTDGVLTMMRDSLRWIDANTFLYYRVYDENQNLDLGYATYTWGHPTQSTDAILKIIGESGNFEISEDGRYLPIQAQNALYIHDLETHQRIRVVQDAERRWSGFRWSHDSCRLTYIETDYGKDTNHELWTYDVCTDTLTFVMGNVPSSEITWSYDDTYFAYVEDVGTEIVIRVVDLSAPEIPVFEYSVRSIHRPQLSWSPISNQFVFIARDFLSRRSNIAIADVEAGTVTPISHYNSQYRLVEWSPDGQHIAVAADFWHSPTYHFDDRIYVMDVDGRNIRRISNVRGLVIHMEWQPLP